MGKRLTKTIRSFQEKGFYDTNTNTIIGSKDGEETNILDILKLLAEDGEEISITIKHEDSVEDIVASAEEE